MPGRRFSILYWPPPSVEHRPDFFDQRRARSLDGHARQHRAGGDLARRRRSTAPRQPPAGSSAPGWRTRRVARQPCRLLLTLTPLRRGRIAAICGRRDSRERRMAKSIEIWPCCASFARRLSRSPRNCRCARARRTWHDSMLEPPARQAEGLRRFERNRAVRIPRKNRPGEDVIVRGRQTEERPDEPGRDRQGADRCDSAWKQDTPGAGVGTGSRCRRADGSRRTIRRPAARLAARRRHSERRSRDRSDTMSASTSARRCRRPRPNRRSWFRSPPRPRSPRAPSRFA